MPSARFDGRNRMYLVFVFLLNYETDKKGNEMWTEIWFSDLKQGEVEEGTR